MIETVIDRISQSGVFGTSERQPALLRYLVTEELCGRGENLKAYTIGTDVLGRGARFDPTQDAIVRVEIGRLRKSLELYFATIGKAEPIRIVIEKGNYRPQFIVKAPPATKPAAVSATRRRSGRSVRHTLRRLWAWLAVSAVALAAITTTVILLSREAPQTEAYSEDSPQLFVAQPEVIAPGEQSEALRFELQAVLAQELRGRTWLSVSIGTSDPQARRPTFMLKPALSTAGDQWTLTAVLTREPEREVVWTGRYSGAADLTQPDSLRQGVAALVNRDLGPLTGPISEAVAMKSEVTSPLTATPFSCIVNVRRFFRYNTRRQFMDSKACALRHLEATPTLIEMRAILAYLFVLEATQPNLSPLPTLIGGTVVTTREARREALLREAEIIQRGASPADRIMLQQHLVLAACRGDVEAIRASMPALLAFQSNIADPHVVRAVLLGPMLGDWGAALEAEARAFALMAHPTPRYQVVSGIKAAMDDNPVEALRLLTRAPMHGYAAGHLLVGLFAAEAGATPYVRSARLQLADLGYRDETAYQDLINDSCYNDAVKNRLHRALKAFVAFKAE